MNGLRSYRYLLVDVFTERPLEGNALAVFPEASGLDDATMRKIARDRINRGKNGYVLHTLCH
jgi:trans-2,3-dihydro-3-hydroxyanthranilate isomerase